MIIVLCFSQSYRSCNVCRASVMWMLTTASGLISDKRWKKPHGDKDSAGYALIIFNMVYGPALINTHSPESLYCARWLQKPILMSGPVEHGSRGHCRALRLAGSISSYREKSSLMAVLWNSSQQSTGSLVISMLSDSSVDEQLRENMVEM